MVGATVYNSFSALLTRAGERNVDDSMKYVTLKSLSTSGTGQIEAKARGNTSRMNIFRRKRYNKENNAVIKFKSSAPVPEIEERKEDRAVKTDVCENESSLHSSACVANKNAGIYPANVSFISERRTVDMAESYHSSQTHKCWMAIDLPLCTSKQQNLYFFLVSCVVHFNCQGGRWS